MDRFIIKRETMATALKTLENAIQDYKFECAKTQNLTIIQLPRTLQTYRDSVIHRFEYCVDYFWKYLKVYIEEIAKLTVDAKNPRAIFRSACNGGLMSEAQTILALDMLDARNNTTHTYNEALANKICQEIPQYYELMRTILNQLSKEL